MTLLFAPSLCKKCFENTLLIYKKMAHISPGPYYLIPFKAILVLALLFAKVNWLCVVLQEDRLPVLETLKEIY